jgi:predicted flap endonuclease-1-like 5' DNA nuclease
MMINPISRRGFPFFPFLGVIFFLAGALWVVLAARRNQTTLTRRRSKKPHSSAIELPDTMPTAALPAPDALTILEGIGPKVQAVLQSAGITNFKQLAKSTPEKLKTILAAAGNRISDPTTWPEQAALAAKANWDQLKALQATLKGGRRID